MGNKIKALYFYVEVIENIKLFFPLLQINIFSYTERKIILKHFLWLTHIFFLLSFRQKTTKKLSKDAYNRSKIRPIKILKWFLWTTFLMMRLSVSQNHLKTLWISKYFNTGQSVINKENLVLNKAPDNTSISSIVICMRKAT